jgi:hypothetical protein
LCEILPLASLEPRFDFDVQQCGEDIDELAFFLPNSSISASVNGLNFSFCGPI